MAYLCNGKYNYVNGLTDISDNIMAYLCNEKDMCETNPCQNGGHCVSERNSYFCECREGFAGQNCDQACDAKADVAFLIDSSGSIGQHNFRLVKDFVYKVVEELTIGKRHTRTGLVSYSTSARMGFHLDDYITKSGVEDAISSVGYVYGNTNTAAGIKMVRRSVFNPSRGDRPDAQNFLIIITDGVSNVKAENTIPEAQKAKEEGVHVITIGVGSFDSAELRAMASEPTDNNMYIIDDFNSFAGLKTNLVKATCRDESICNDNPCLNGGVCSVGVNTFQCKCPTGYSGLRCEKACIDRKDIVFVLDSSSSVGKDNFQYMLDFVRALVEEIAGTSNEHRFALITYSTRVNLVFSLGRYSNGNVGKVISTTRYKAGSTNTAGGLRTAADVLKMNGGRSSAEDIVILLTDGQSNLNSRDTIPSAEALKQKGVKVITVGIKITDTDEIKAIASSEKEVFIAKDFQSLTDIKQEISENSCQGNGR
ncbi:unnamed protein product [Mytilus coruscus]|uniref:COL6A n=1 Tax=Mytilus coruscus TaxID=42192 RepID=A0A6J8ECW2_MYTCO|nr:unnamed protein product [Mytilus coruscus]CAC5417436.1 unnamed protein product [Mytilus coruscus]